VLPTLDFAIRNGQLVLICHGDAEANRGVAETHGLNYPILLLQEGQRVEAFAREGTTAAHGGLSLG
jgi:hypothetical protein